MFFAFQPLVEEVEEALVVSNGQELGPELNASSKKVPSGIERVYIFIKLKNLLPFLKRFFLFLFKKT
jgi:hypothetical protein